MQNTFLNLFAYLNNSDNPVRRIVLSNDLQVEITNFFLDLKNNFYQDQEKIDFDGNYNVDEGEIFRISNFPLPSFFINAIQNPLQINPLDIENEVNKISALFTGRWNEASKFICFQIFDRRKLLSRNKFAIIFSGNTFQKLEDPGLILQDNLTALIWENELLFYSYHNTRRILDLSNYYREATDAELEEFASIDMFEIENLEEFKAISDSMIRKKIALIQKNGVLNSVTVEYIYNKAQEYDIEINTNNGKIIIPYDKKKLKEFVKFLDEDYFIAPLTGRKCFTNSKKYITGQ